MGPAPFLSSLQLGVWRPQVTATQGRTDGQAGAYQCGVRARVGVQGEGQRDHRVNRQGIFQEVEP